MNIGFWNIAGKTSNRLRILIKEFAISKELDLLILLENNFNESDILESLNQDSVSYSLCPSRIPETWFTVYSKQQPEFASPLNNDGRLEARRIINNITGNFTLIMLHYQSKLYWQDADQNAHSPEIKSFIETVEQGIGDDRTVVLGDFNMNPFQHGMVQTTGLHATMDKNIATTGQRVVDGKSYKFFYNPMWSFYGHGGKSAALGSYFHQAARPINYFWNIFDQVLIRPSLLKQFDEASLEIISELANISLLKGNKIDAKISDHLPIFFTLLPNT